jgi:outer membrane protein OmpA-like peptidoglycan-associated protein
MESRLQQRGQKQSAGANSHRQAIVRPGVTTAAARAAFHATILQEMNMPFFRYSSLVTVFALLLALGSTLASAQSGKLNLRVTPKQAYVFVDDRAISEASKHPSLSLSVGEHKIEIVNYGYTPVTRAVNIEAGETADLEVSLQAAGERVSGQFGAISIKGADRDAVLLNGKTPDFFVGHGDEFNTDFLWWKQELVVPPGTYEVTIKGQDKDIWSGSVNVAQDERTIVEIPNGVQKMVSWHRGEKLTTGVPRFTAGIASATVAVAKPTAALEASTAQLNCGDVSQLKWTSSDAPQVEINSVGAVPISGEQAVQPKETTTYTLKAVGPGGSSDSSVTVNVNTAVQADLKLSPSVIQYKRVGDKVVEDDGAALSWSATNASAVAIDSLGGVETSGSRTLALAPHKTDPGPVDETVSYTLKATNDCGGIQTQTVALRIVGSIEPSALSMRSVFFPTDRPRRPGSEAALLPSEEETLQTVAEEFKKYLAYKSDAHLVLSGHADRRGPETYNKLLSERRAELAKQFLVEQGVPAENIETQAFGKDNNLSTDKVKQLLDQDAALSTETRQTVMKKLGNLVLAYNRRVDLTLNATGQESALTYPFNADDFASLVDRNGVKKASGVELAAEKERIGN